jgi:threonine dehydrogenase-like Zn-dependent dehydrogenase
MQALQVDGQLALSPNYPDPKVAVNQALIQVQVAGICNTDLELVKGYMGFRGVLGHEFVGKVVQGSPEWMGKRVVGEINVADGTCDICLAGVPSQCRNRTTVGIDRHQGAFAQFLALQTSNLHVVPDTVPNDHAVFVEPLAAACNILELVHVSPRDRIVVIGAGKLGLLCAQVLKLTGAEVSVVVRREKPAKLLKQWGIEAKAREQFQNQRATIVVDCTGTSEGFEAAQSLVQPRGTIVLKSTYVGIPTANLTRAVIDEIKIVGSRCGSFEAALRLLDHGLVDVQSMIEARYPFTEAIRAFDHAFEAGVLKVLLDF